MCLDVKSNVQDVAILYLICLALEPLQATPRSFGG